MKGKANAFNLLTLVVAYIGAFMAGFSPVVQMWLGIVSFTISAILSTYSSNGAWVKGWGKSAWVVAVAGTVIQVANHMGAVGAVSVSTITMVVTGISIFINVIYKSYDGNTSIAEKSL